MCIGLDWDKDGEVLAILMKDCSIVFLWDLHSKGLVEARRTPSNNCRAILEYLTRPSLIRWKAT